MGKNLKHYPCSCCPQRSLLFMAENTAHQGNVPEDEEKKGEEEKGGKDLLFSNALQTRLLIEIQPIKVNKKTNSRMPQQIGLGVGPDSFNARMKMEKTHLEEHETEVQRHTIPPHGTWKIATQLKKAKKGRAGMVEKTMQVHLSTADNPLGIFTMAPGDGLIVSDVCGQIMVEQLMGKKFLRSRDPWKTNLEISRNPHASMDIGDRCDFCKALIK